MRSVTYYSRSKISPTQVLADFPNPADLLGYGAMGRLAVWRFGRLAVCPLDLFAHSPIRHSPIGLSAIGLQRWRPWRWDSQDQAAGSLAAPRFETFTALERYPRRGDAAPTIVLWNNVEGINFKSNFRGGKSLKSGPKTDNLQALMGFIVRFLSYNQVKSLQKPTWVQGRLLFLVRWIR